jgi:hypothetical protein
MLLDLQASVLRCYGSIYYDVVLQARNSLERTASTEFFHCGVLQARDAFIVVCCKHGIHSLWCTASTGFGLLWSVLWVPPCRH